MNRTNITVSNLKIFAEMWTIIKTTTRQRRGEICQVCESFTLRYRNIIFQSISLILILLCHCTQYLWHSWKEETYSRSTAYIQGARTETHEGTWDWTKMITATMLCWIQKGIEGNHRKFHMLNHFETLFNRGVVNHMWCVRAEKWGHWMDFH